MTTISTARIAILGNSVSGKSTLARLLAQNGTIPTLDLDAIFWEPIQLAAPRPSAAADPTLHAFCGDGHGS